MRRRAKADSNQGDIIIALQKAGAFVKDMSRVGDGWPDLCIWFRGATHWLEVKADAREARRTDTSTAQRQQEIRDRARECGVHIYVVTSEEEALRAIGAMA